MISSHLIKILMFYVRMQIDRLMCPIDLDVFNIEERKVIHNTFILAHFDY